jgi:pantetheine-phosphate adenylyltransferase
MTSTVICPGSYDPITYGHIDAIREAARISGSAVCAIGTNPKKKYLFSLSERENLARLALKKVPRAPLIIRNFPGLRMCGKHFGSGGALL